MVWQDYIPPDLQRIYEVRDYRHAAAILANEARDEFGEICQALRTFRLTQQNILDPGGNESRIPKKFSEILRPLGWKEGKLRAQLEPISKIPQ